MNGIANWDDLEDAVSAEIARLNQEYGVRSEQIVQELTQDLVKIRRQKRLGIARLSEAIFYSIRVKHAVVRDSYINKNLQKLVRQFL